MLTGHSLVSEEAVLSTGPSRGVGSVRLTSAPGVVLVRRRGPLEERRVVVGGVTGVLAAVHQAPATDRRKQFDF